MRRLRNAALALASALAIAPGVLWAQTEFPAGIAPRNSDDGLVLADRQGRELYRLDQDRAFRRFRGLGIKAWSRCDEACKMLWQPVAPPPGFTPDGDWGIAERPDGAKQLTYKKDALYLYMGKSFEDAAKLDIAPSYLSGYAGKPLVMEDGLPRVTLYWHTIPHEPPAPKTVAPAGVTPHWFKASFLYTDAKQRKLYTPKSTRECSQECGALKPLAAPLAALPVGDWRPVQDKDGLRVWAYRGRVVYQPQDADETPGADWQTLEVR